MGGIDDGDVDDVGWLDLCGRQVKAIDKGRRLLRLP